MAAAASKFPNVTTVLGTQCPADPIASTYPAQYPAAGEFAVDLGRPPRFNGSYARRLPL